MTEYFLIGNKKFVPETVGAVDFRFCWDDQNPDYNYKCRTQSGGWVGPDNPPAVLRFYPDMRESGDYRVNLEKDPTWRWRETIIALNGGDAQKFGYIIDSNRAQFNTTGWARMAYLGMSGNAINVLGDIGVWYKFETLKPTDWLRARSMSIESHPHLIHRFTCVTWKNNTTVRIPSTGTPRGQVYYPLVTNEGYAYIPKRHVVRVAQ